MKFDWLPDGKTIDRGRVAEQILEDLKDRILTGKLVKGDKLPSERELAQGYGVSGATVREATRALATMHMIEVRHGSGAYVTADAEQMIALSLSSMVRLERLSIGESLGVLAVLNAYAAELATQRATTEDIQRLEEALNVMQTSTKTLELEAALRQFLHGLAEASHNPLLVALCKFLASLQIDMARKIANGSAKTWRETTGYLTQERCTLVTAISQRDAAAARAAAVAYHRRAAEVIASLRA